MRIITPEDLAVIAREQRRELGLDQATLARRVGVSRKWIVDFEKGKPSVELSLVLQVLKALDLPLYIAHGTSGGEPGTPTPGTPTIDIDAIVTGARGKK